MKHLATIQAEFLKAARDWDEMTLEEQKDYLKKHPKSKRKITAKPEKDNQLDSLKSTISTIDPEEIDFAFFVNEEKHPKSKRKITAKPEKDNQLDSLKSTISEKRNTLTKIDDDERFIPFENSGPDDLKPGQLVKIENKNLRFLGHDPNDDGSIFIDEKGNPSWHDFEGLINNIQEVPENEAINFKQSQRSINNKKLINIDDQIYRQLGDVEGTFGFGGSDAIALMDENGNVSTIDPEEIDSDDDEGPTISTNQRKKFKEIEAQSTKNIWHI